jgi:uncharacterized protein (DUF1697 family)
MSRKTSQPAEEDTMAAYVALLRAVNVGSYGRMSMKDLQGWLADVGGTDITTYVQSGNVVFNADSSSPAGVAEALENRIAEACGLDVDVLVRTAKEIKKVATNNPFFKPGSDPRTLHVTFLAEKPDRDEVGALSAPPGPDQFHIAGREIYLYLPNGIGRTKLNNAFFGKLRMPATTRNWNTVTKLVELSSELANKK